MRRTATTTLALACGLSLSACNTITGNHVRTEMIVANHTGRAISVSLAQSEENTAAPIAVGQSVPPEGTVRYTGKEGDEVVVTVGDEPPLRLIFAKRSQVVKVRDAGGELSYDIYRGYTDPTK